MSKNAKKKIKEQEFEQITKIPISKVPAGSEKGGRMSDITWRIFRIMAEFIEGFEFLSETEREVTIFGSTRIPKNNQWYKQAEKLGNLLAENKFTVITGGGPGIMEAANKGAKESGGVSMGLNIYLPHEQRINPYVTKGKGFYYFFTRKVMMAASAQAYVFFPGGFGTLDEFFEIITLVQTEKIVKIPVICVGKDYWSKLDKFIEEVMLKQYKGIDAKDRNVYNIVDSAEEAYELIKDSEERTFF